MGDGYDRFENEGGNGSSFVMGLLTGTVLGAGLGMLFAPKSGSELRGQISDQAGSLANTASEGYRRATQTASDAVARGADEAQRYVRDAASGVAAGAESMRGESTEHTRGSGARRS